MKSPFTIESDSQITFETDEWEEAFDAAPLFDEESQNFNASQWEAAVEELDEQEFAEELREEEFSFGPLADAALQGARSSQENSVVKRALASGQRDEDKLSNLVFFARHPERTARPITRGEPNFEALRREWLEIRDRLVRPLLAPGPKPGSTSGPNRCQPVKCTEREPQLQRMKALVPILNKYRGSIPLDFLLGWVARESGGCLPVVTKICERGYFQVHPSEASKIGANPELLSTDRDYSVRMGIEMVKDKMKHATKLGVVPGTDLFWPFVKLLHWLPAGVGAIISLMKARRVWPPRTWAAFSGFTEANRVTIIQTIGETQKRPRLLQDVLASPGHGWDPLTGIRNASATVEKGRQWAERLRQAGSVGESREMDIFAEIEREAFAEEEDVFGEIEREAFAEERETALPQSALDLLRSGSEGAGLLLAIAAGHTDENQLTNLIFFVRHPERNGRPLAREESRFAELSREWLSIRDQVVRPALVSKPGGQPPTLPPSGGFPSGRTAPPPPVEGPYAGITGARCPSGRGKCWSGAKSKDIIDSDAPWNNQTNRSASNYSAVLDYFNPGTCSAADKAACMRLENPRYRRTATSTYCNIYVHDVTRAMWASIPHWVRSPSQRKPPVGWNELSANGTVDWMLRNAPAAGWVLLDQAFCQWLYEQFTQQRSLPYAGRPLPREIVVVVSGILSGRHADPNLLKQNSYVAQQFANAGLPAAIVWKNPTANRSGHVSMVRPETNSLRGRLHSSGRFMPRSAQAGARNFANDLASWAVNLKTALFYVHA
jgi:hypothetical protein